jgi:micrococcal nuclease
MEVRLAGIATPNILTKGEAPEDVYRQRAREYLVELLLDKVVQINGYDTDSENRVVAEVYLNGLNINLEMLRAGFAEVYHEQLYRDLNLGPYRRMETEARNAGRGMWALGGRQ